jgi:cell division septation protein DedD
MRFEIKAGGAFLIVVGLLGLSLIVFALGLFAGYDMARNTVPEAAQAASVYPLPNPPAESAKASTKSSDEVASTQPAPKPAVKAKAPSIDSGASSLSMDKNAGPVTTPPPRTIASAPAPPPKVSPPEAPPDVTAHFTKPEVTNPAEKYTSDGDASGGRHGKPFNIQIDAVMDRSNAEQMTTRLQKLGYHAFMVPTDISGQTWWRVRVGPYQSQDEASAAEQELRAKYKDTYSP